MWKLRGAEPSVALHCITGGLQHWLQITWGDLNAYPQGQLLRCVTYVTLGLIFCRHYLEIHNFLSRGPTNYGVDPPHLSSSGIIKSESLGVGAQASGFLES